MANRPGNARVYITGDAKGLQNATKQGEQALGKMAKAGTGHLGNLAKAAAAAGTAYLGIAEAKTAINTTEDLAKATLALHRALGLSVTEASRWAAVARARGVETKALQMSFGTLSKNVEAGVTGYGKQRQALDQLGVTQKDQIKRHDLLAKGAGTQAAAFERLGVTQKDLQSGDFERVLGKVADGLGKLPGGTERAAIAMKLFGRGWQTIVPLMNDGNKGMREQLALADKYGVTFSGKTVKSIKELILAQREQKFATMGLQLALGQQLIPTLTKVIGAGNKFVAGMRDGTGAGGRFAKTAKEIAADLKPMVVWVGNAVKSIAEFGASHRHVADVAAGVVAVGVALKALKFASAITGFSTLLKIAKTTAGAIPPMYRRAGQTAAAETAAGYTGALPGAMGGRKGQIETAGSGAGKWFGRAMGAAAVVGFSELAVTGINSVRDELNKKGLWDPPGGKGGFWDNLIPSSLLPKGDLKLDGPLGKVIAGLLGGGGGSKGPSGGGLPLLSQKPGPWPQLRNKPWSAPTGGQGKLIGGPNVPGSTHDPNKWPNNWQSDNAVDISVKVGTPILAVEGGTVAKVNLAGGTGRFAGSAVTINGDSGNSYYYAHLSGVSVKAGQQVKAGQPIGSSGSANGVAHLHFATAKGDPRTLKLAGGGMAVNALSAEQRTVYAAAKKYGIDPAILWGVYGQESNFGKNTGPSSAGALGPFQLMPDTARSLGVDPNNFKEAAYGAARYLAQYKGRGTRGMLAAYNAGPNGNPDNAQTRAYIPGVLGYAKGWGTVQDGQVPTDPTSWRTVAQQIAQGVIRPIAQRLRSSLAGPISAISQQDSLITRYTDASSIASSSGDLAGQRDAQIGLAYARREKQAALQSAARRYSAAIKRLKSKLRSAPKAQRSTINAQIKLYQTRLTSIRDEARQLGVQVQIDASDLKQTMADIATLRTTDTADWAGGYQGFLDARGVAASLTPDTADDISLGQSTVAWYQRQYDTAVKSGDLAGQVQWGGQLKNAKDQVASLTAPGAVGVPAKLQSALAMAGLSKDTGDDLGVLGQIKDFWGGALKDAQLRANDEDITQAATELKNTQDAIDALTNAVSDNTARLEAQNKLLQDQADAANRLATVAQNETGTLGKAFMDWMSGSLGGRIGPGFQTPGAAGVGARY